MTRFRGTYSNIVDAGRAILTYLSNHGQALGDYGTFASSLVGIFLALVAIRQLKYTRRALEVSDGQLNAAQEQVDLAQQQATSAYSVSQTAQDTLRETVRESTKSRIAQAAPAVAVLPLPHTFLACCKSEEPTGATLADKFKSITPNPLPREVTIDNYGDEDLEIWVSGLVRFRNEGALTSLVAWDYGLEEILTSDVTRGAGRELILTPGDECDLRWYHQYSTYFWFDRAEVASKSSGRGAYELKHLGPDDEEAMRFIIWTAALPELIDRFSIQYAQFLPLTDHSYEHREHGISRKYTCDWKLPELIVKRERRFPIGDLKIHWSEVHRDDSWRRA